MAKTDAQADDNAPVALYDLEVDLTGIKTEYEPLAKGSYPARCTGSEPRIGQDSGEPYLNVEFTFTEGDAANRKTWNSYSLQPQALWRLKGDMIRMGVEPARLEQKVSISDIQQELEGRDCVLNLDVETYTDKQGVKKTRNKVASLTSLNGSFAAAPSGRAF